MSTSRSLRQVVGWLPQCVSKPSPSSVFDLVYGWHLVCALPQVCIADGVGPTDLEDPSPPLSVPSPDEEGGGLGVR